MSASTTVTKIVSFPDEPEAVLEYLAARTSETVGRRVDRSGAVVLARVSGLDVVEGPGGRIASVGLVVERPLAGAVSGGTLTLAYPLSAVGTAPAEPEPTLAAGDRAVFFLTHDAPDSPYRLARGDADVVRDGSVVDEVAEAVDWYAALPGEWAGRRAALSSALSRPSARIARTAARALGESKGASAADALENALVDAGPDLRVRLMLALWLLGLRERAVELLLSAYEASGKDAWLAEWGLASSVDAEGRREAVLYGPDPSEARGD
jgi:hypothetical protein